MPRVYLFQCPRCEYSARITGGLAEGYHCTTQTIICRDCKTLSDAVVRERVPDPPAPPLKKYLPDAPTPSNTLKFGEPPRVRWTTRDPVCPISADHHVEPWTTPGKCPRCGNYLDQAGLPFRVWD